MFTKNAGYVIASWKGAGSLFLGVYPTGPHATHISNSCRGLLVMPLRKNWFQ